MQQVLKRYLKILMWVTSEDEFGDIDSSEQYTIKIPIRSNQDELEIEREINVVLTDLRASRSIRELRGWVQRHAEPPVEGLSLQFDDSVSFGNPVLCVELDVEMPDICIVR